jgi:hypothetical protein
MAVDFEPALTLANKSVAVEPGREARAHVTVRNPSDIVEEYRFDVVGPASSWATVVPPTRKVFTTKTADVEIVFRPPLGPGAPAGTISYGVRCRSSNYADRVNVVEGEVVVAPVQSIEMRLSPVFSHGRWGGRHRVQLYNKGSVPTRVNIDASDDSDALAFAIAPTAVEVPAGLPAEAMLRARTHHPFLRGKPAQRRFQVQASYGNPPIALPPAAGVFEQRPIISKRLLMIVAIAVAGIAALLALSAHHKGANSAAIAPAYPTGVTSTANGGTITVQWRSASSGVDVYKIREVQPNTVENSVPAPDNTFAVANLKPGKYCFVVIAVAKKAESDPSDPQSCASVGGPAGIKAPTNVMVTPSPDGTTVTLSWQTDPSLAHFKSIIYMNGTALSPPVAPDRSEVGPISAPTPYGQQCYQVETTMDSNTSPLSAQQCVTVAGPPTTTLGNGVVGPGTSDTTPATVEPVSGNYFILQTYDSANGSAPSEAQALVNVDSTKIRLVPPGTSGLSGVRAGLWVAIADGFQTQAQAAAWCNQHQVQLAANHATFACNASIPAG